MESKPKISLSASKIKTLKTCSWIYYSNYVLKIPQTANSGASRGLCSHIVLECLVNLRHRKHLNQILKKGTFSEALKRLILINARKLQVDDEDNLDMIFAMIGTAVNYDFLCEGATEIIAERHFKIEGDKYIINGYIDKQAHYEGGVIKILDYKTSKIKFSKEEIEANLQALMYSLACWKETKIIPSIDFLFLRFPKKPLQSSPKFTEYQLKGFERFLESVAENLANFTEKDARNDLAANSKDNRWLCGKHGKKPDGSKHFICQYREPKTYYKGVDENGKFVNSSFVKEDISKDKRAKKIQTIKYAGCVAFHG